MMDDVNVASYADDKTPYTHVKFPKKVLQKLAFASRNVFQWLLNNAMKANPGKWNFLSNLDMITKISVSILDIENTHFRKLLGVQPI